MSTKSRQFAMESLPERPIKQAGLLLGISEYGGPVAVPAVLVLDLAADEFVRVPGIPDDPAAEALCLAPDGHQIVLLNPHHGKNGAVGLHTLATSQQTWYPNLTAEHTHAAALAPDGTQIAILSTTLNDPGCPDDDVSASLINLIDVLTGDTRRLWWNSGGWSQQSTISWAPDGTLLAATFLDPEEDLVTVVIEPVSGTEIARYPYAAVLASANGAWRGQHELIYLDEEFHVLATDLDTGAQQVIAQVYTPPIAAFDDHYIQHANDSAPGTAGLTWSLLDETEPQPFITIHSSVAITTCDVLRTRSIGQGPLSL